MLAWLTQALMPKRNTINLATIMLKPRDQIAKPRAGCIFPLSVAQVLAEIKNSAFRIHYYEKRPALLFQHCDVECPLGHQLASFIHKQYLSVFSLPDNLNKKATGRALVYAIGEFARIDHGPQLAKRSQQIIVYRAYLGPLNRVAITQDIVNAGNRAYLLTRTVSKVSKSRSIQHHETLLATTEVK